MRAEGVVDRFVDADSHSIVPVDPSWPMFVIKELSCKSGVVFRRRVNAQTHSAKQW